MTKRVSIVLAVIFMIVYSGSIASAQMADEKLDCWGCHRLPNLNTTLGVYAANQICWQCHEVKAQRKTANATVDLLVSKDRFRRSSHGQLPCIYCHEGIAHTPHYASAAVSCQPCHRDSAARMVVAEHTDVDCLACHMREGSIGRLSGGRIELVTKPEAPLLSHKIEAQVNCARCHVKGNQVGAPIKTPGKKGILCVGCHPAHLAATSRLDLIPLAIFLIGFAANLAFWLRGTIPGPSQNAAAKVAYLFTVTGRAVFSRRIAVMARGLLLDGILHRRLFKESLGRWLVHMMIFGMILARFALSIYIIAASKYYPLLDLNQKLINIRTPWVALAFELSGLAVILGIVFALLKRIRREAGIKQSSGPDWTLIIMVAILFIAGFCLKILQTAGQGLDIIPWFIPVSALLASYLSPESAREAYVYGWTTHVIWVYIIIAYLPFSKAWHVLVSPLVTMFNYQEK